jgi:hypothetical protein
VTHLLANNSVETAAAVVGAFAGLTMAIAALAAIPWVRKVVGVFWDRNVRLPKEARLVDLIRRTQEPMHAKLDAVQNRLEVVEIRTEQLLPNGGNSLADKVNKVKAVIAPEPGDPIPSGPASES